MIDELEMQQVQISEVDGNQVWTQYSILDKMLLHLVYKLTIGDKRADTDDEPQASTAVAITVALDTNTPADSLTLVLGQVGAFRFTPGSWAIRWIAWTNQRFVLRARSKNNARITS